MILDMIGHQLVGTELVHAELKKAGSSLVKRLVLLFLKHFHVVWCRNCQPDCSEEKATLKTKSVGKIPQHLFSQTKNEVWSINRLICEHSGRSVAANWLVASQGCNRYLPQDDRPVRNKIAVTYSVINPHYTLHMLTKHTHKMPHP